jgi:hypothetical protein
MTESGRAALARAVKDQTIHLAWGTGEDGWDDDPPSLDASATELENEIGRVCLHNSLFVVPDEEGGIILPDNKRYSASETPTRHLYMHFKFGFADGVGSTIRELGIFLGGTVKHTVPPGKSYLLPGDIQSPGILFMIEHPAPLIREGSQEYTASWIISL